jgi:hypothetical protein
VMTFTTMPSLVELGDRRAAAASVPDHPCGDYRPRLTSTGGSALCTTPDDAEPSIVDATASRRRQAMPVHAYTTERAHRGLGGRTPRERWAA